ncbi:hypothetical protein [Acinetobacter harbinensis]|uniref:hypothetical protein n=1 Tax=Acinetobacter harbinensis TaxID=1353941 RepID=UPI001C4FB355|nr:hypothetical protein [Acinetobacter harbinensis]
MNKTLKIKFQNCFGIGELEHEFKFTTRERAQLIYAPNGTMKSSFANIFEFVSQDKIGKVADRIFLEKPTICEITINDNLIDKDEVVVVNAETITSQNSITRFIARTELKNRYDEIYNELLDEKAKFMVYLKRQSRSSDCEGELKAVYNEGETFFEYLHRIEKDLSNTLEEYSFKYNDIFDKGNKVKVFLESNKNLLDDYLQRYTQLLEHSKFFNKSSNSFGTVQASNLLNSLSDNSFFDAGHQINLQSNDIIVSRKELADLIQEEVDQILKDADLLKKFDKVDKALGKNAELKAFKTLLENDQTLLVELKDYEGFRNKIWLSHISVLEKETRLILDIYKSRKAELLQIIGRANDDVEKWNTIIEIFNSRFYVPFTISLQNQSDIILKNDIPKLIFTYKGNIIPNNDEKLLLEVLSRGESRAYYILRFLFEIESRIEENSNLLIVFDDVADSFDYKNKYAIIEYIKDLLDQPNVNAVILTHNFDFYRTVAKRLSIKPTSFMASKCNQGIVKINKGKYFEDVFKNIFVKNYNNEKFFIGLIPFVRNLFEYLANDEAYNFLTSCLHIKSNTKSITADEVHKYLKKVILDKAEINLEFKNKKIIDIIFDEAEKITAFFTDHSIDLEDKLIVSIACRLKAELYMIDQISIDELNNINKDQTQKLYQLCKEKGIDPITLKLLNRVNLITPEHIHVNSFMFEPLVDMSMNHLVDLYKDISALCLDVGQAV